MAVRTSSLEGSFQQISRRLGFLLQDHHSPLHSPCSPAEASRWLSDPRNRNHKSLAIANHNFEVARFFPQKSQWNRSFAGVSESQWFFWVVIAVASDLRFEVAAIRVTKVGEFCLSLGREIWREFCRIFRTHKSEPPRLPLPPKHPKLRPWSEFHLPRNSDHGLSFSFPW